MRRSLLVLLVVALLGVFAPPALAGNAEEIQSCSKAANYPLSTCRPAVYGVRGTINHFDPILADGGRLVQSQYVYVAADRYVEFAWYQEEQIFGGYTDRYLTILYENTSTQNGAGCPFGSYSPGQNDQCQYGNWNINSTPNGPITLSIQQTNGDGTFRFYWKRGYENSGYAWVNLANFNPPGTWVSGISKANQEMRLAGDECGYYHDTMKIQNGQNGWLFGGAYNWVELWDGSSCDPYYYQTSYDIWYDL